MKTTSLILAIVLLLLACVTTTASAVVVKSEFNAGDGGDGRDGWYGNYPEDGYTGNNPGDTGGSVTWYDLAGGEGCLKNYEPAILYYDGFVAPAKFLGDWWSSIQGGYGYISFDYKKGTWSGVFDLYVRISSEADEWVPDPKYDTASGLDWNQYTVPLDESEWTHTHGSKTWEDTLSNVTEFFVGGDWAIGVENNYLDNFTLTLVPEPSTLLLLSFGAVILRKKAGRTHQIRVHLPHIGLPLVIDPLYGSTRPLYLSYFKPDYRLAKDQIEKPLIERLTLHAYQIQLTERQDSCPVCFVAGLDKKFAATIKMLTKHNPKGLDAFFNPDDFTKIVERKLASWFVWFGQDR